jgi:dihydrodipicolinate synthase/N-acetylneuraminate lyase
MKTNFSFEVQHAAPSETSALQRAASGTAAERDELMHKLQPLLTAQFEPLDAAAVVQVSDSHRGANNKLVELVTTLADEQIAGVLKRFCEVHGVTITALE